MSKTPKFSYDEIIGSLMSLDLHCDDYYTSNEKKGAFVEVFVKYSDSIDDIYLKIEVDEKYVKVIGGKKLSTSEKSKKWHYSKYNHVDDLTDDLGSFIREYFKSWKLVRTIKM